VTVPSLTVRPHRRGVRWSDRARSPPADVSRPPAERRGPPLYHRSHPPSSCPVRRRLALRIDGMIPTIQTAASRRGHLVPHV